MTKHGSPEHFQQVISAHLVGLTGFCRCGASVASYREHIAQVWQPHQLPEGWVGR